MNVFDLMFFSLVFIKHVLYKCFKFINHNKQIWKVHVAEYIKVKSKCNF